MNDSAGNLRSTANETFRRLVGVSKHANVRANSNETREMCSRERVADGVVPETSHNRKIYVRPKPGKKEDTSTVCRVAKTTFYYTTQTTSKKQYQFFRFSEICTSLIMYDFCVLWLLCVRSVVEIVTQCTIYNGEIPSQNSRGINTIICEFALRCVVALRRCCVAKNT